MEITFSQAPMEYWCGFKREYMAVAQQGRYEIRRLLDSRDQFESFIKDACKVFKTEDYTLHYKDHVPPLVRK